MAVANTNSALRVSDLDFFSIRNNLKDFLRSQDTFVDYDFEGSGMAILLDVLAYNTYYNSYYLNMVANESFLDTAQLRQNILSLAKAVNYVPTSAKGAIAQIDVRVTPTPAENTIKTSLTLDKYTRLIGADIDGVNYSFVTINSNTASKSAGSFFFPNVQIKQGEVITQQFLMEPSNKTRRFQIPSSNVDTSTLIVTVQESASNTHTTEYKQAQDITEVTGESYVYFLEEDENLYYTIQFGDGYVGYRPKNGNIIQVTYLDTSGAVANNIARFSFAEPVGGLYRNKVVVTTQKLAAGGTDKESVDDIRFRAQQSYMAQNRAVTVNDYESIITKGYNNIDSVSIWGGEDNSPPVYGKVYMSLKTKDFYSLTDEEKEIIKNDLIKKSNVLTVTPEIVDPNYNFVLVAGSVTYNPNLTTKTSQELHSIVENAIKQYAQDELNTFKSTLRKSRLQYYIDTCDPAITASDIDIFLQKQIELELNQSRRYTANFNTEIYRSDNLHAFYSYPSISVYDAANVLRKVFFEDVPSDYSGVSSISIIRPGREYLEPPTVTIVGDGVGATAVATLQDDRIASIKVTNAGRNYTYAQIVISGGGGREAAASATLQENIGIIRTYYTLSNGDKVIVNSNAGTVNYATGTMSLVPLFPAAITTNSYYDTDVMTFNIVPKNDIIMPSRNRILALDPNNTQSIQIRMVAQAE